MDDIHTTDAYAHRAFLMEDPWACYEDEDAACATPQGVEEAEPEIDECGCCCC